MKISRILLVLIILCFCTIRICCAQIGCSKQEVCEYEKLFKEFNEYNEYSVGVSFDSSIFYFNYYHDICISLVIYSYTDEFLFNIMMKFKCDTLPMYSCNINKIENMYIYEFTSNNLLRKEDKWSLK